MPKAKSKRTRARLTFIEANAVQAVLDALERGEVSIFYAEQIAHSPPELQVKLLPLMPQAKEPPSDPKTVQFPGAENRLANKEYAEDNKATSDQELKAGRYFSPFQRTFARHWRKLVRIYHRHHPYLEMWEQAQEMMTILSEEFPDDELKEMKAFEKKHGIGTFGIGFYEANSRE